MRKEGKAVTAARKRRSGGNTILETSLVMVAFMGMLLAAIDYGQFLYVHNALVERARSSARWGAINGPTNTPAIVNRVLYNQSTTGTTPFMGLSASNVSVTTSDINTDNYRMELQIAGYQYTRVSLFSFGRSTGPTIRVSVPLGAYL